jgi:hypothetical protein
MKCRAVTYLDNRDGKSDLRNGTLTLVGLGFEVVLLNR